MWRHWLMASRTGWLAADFHRGAWDVVTEGTVRAHLVVALEEGAEVGLRLDLGAVALEVDLLVFDRTPESLDEDVVQGPPAAVHGELHALVEEGLGELRRRELTTLVGVENFRHPVRSDRAGHGP